MAWNLHPPLLGWVRIASCGTCESRGHVREPTEKQEARSQERQEAESQPLAGG